MSRIAPNRRTRKDLAENLTGYLFVLPVVLFILAFIAYPLIQSLLLSFYKWDGIGPWEFAGLDNYVRMFSKDRYFWPALSNSFKYSIGASLGLLTVGFALAVIIDLRVRFWRLYRFLFFLPITVSTAVVALLWLRIVDPYGVLNTLFEIVHLEFLQQDWLADPSLAMSVIVGIVIWQHSGFPMVIFLAAMQAIDEDIYEAAEIDGATIIRRIFAITIPILKNAFSIVALLLLISAFKVFDIIWIMTRGGPAGATEVLGTHLYQTGIWSNRYGYSSVIAVVILVVSLILSVFYTRISGYRDSTRSG